MRETVAGRIGQLFGIDEADYFLDRAKQGMSARVMASELKMSHVAVNNRLSLYATRQERWIPKQRRRVTA